MPDRISIVFGLALIELHDPVVVHRDLTESRTAFHPGSHRHRPHINEAVPRLRLNPDETYPATVWFICYEGNRDPAVTRGEEIKIVRPPSPYKSQAM